MVVSREQALIEAARAKSESCRMDNRAFLKKVRSIRVERLLFATGLAVPVLLLLATSALRRPMERLYRAFQSAPPTDLRYLPVQASLGLKKLSSLDGRIAERQKTADLYRSLLKPSIRMQQVPENASSTWYFLVAVLPRNAAPIRWRLLLRGIDAGVGNEIADNCARLLGFSDCPAADRVSARAIALPMYDGISDSSVHRVASVLNRLV
jgi:dTDP-4-amino-4,6-dideoxygalactose transaminase